MLFLMYLNVTNLKYSSTTRKYNLKISKIFKEKIIINVKDF